MAPSEPRLRPAGPVKWSAGGQAARRTPAASSARPAAAAGRGSGAVPAVRRRWQRRLCSPVEGWGKRRRGEQMQRLRCAVLGRQVLCWEVKRRLPTGDGLLQPRPRRHAVPAELPLSQQPACCLRSPAQSCAVMRWIARTRPLHLQQPGQAGVCGSVPGAVWSAAPLPRSWAGKTPTVAVSPACAAHTHPHLSCRRWPRLGRQSGPPAPQR